MAAESHSKAMHLASLIALDISLDDFFCALATENINVTKTMIKFSFFIFFCRPPCASGSAAALKFIEIKHLHLLHFCPLQSG
jgi:hypothetical protein